MTFDHRSFQAEDARRICTFLQSAEELYFFLPMAAFPLTPQVLTAEVAKSRTPTVALIGDRVAGYIDFLEITEKRFCAIGRLAVDQAFRRQGAARFLVQTMIAMAADQHQAKFVRASCFSHNTAAYGLYHCMGFKPDDMVQRTTPEGEAALLVNMIFRCRQPGH